MKGWALPAARSFRRGADQRGGVGRHGGPEGSHHQQVVVERAQDVLALEGAVHHLAREARVEVAPGERHAADPALGRERLRAEVVIADGVGAALLGRLHHRDGRVHDHAQHVGALVQQRGGRGRFLGRVEERPGEDHAGLDLRIDGACAQLEGVDVGQEEADGQRDDVADLVGLGDLARGHAEQVERLRRARPVGREVRQALVAAGVRELHVGVPLGHAQCGLQVAEAGRDDEPRAPLDHALHQALGVRALRHVLHLDDFHLGQIALHHLDALGVGLVVAGVGDGADVQDAHDQLGLRGGENGNEEQRDEQHGDERASFQGVSPWCGVIAIPGIPGRGSRVRRDVPCRPTRPGRRGSARTAACRE